MERDSTKESSVHTGVDSRLDLSDLERSRHRARYSSEERAAILLLLRIPRSVCQFTVHLPQALLRSSDTTHLCTPNLSPAPRHMLPSQHTGRSLPCLNPIGNRLAPIWYSSPCSMSVPLRRLVDYPIWSLRCLGDLYIMRI